MPMRSIIRSMFMASCTVLACGTVYGEVLSEKIADAWAQRINSVSTAQFEIESTCFKPKSSLDGRWGFPGPIPRTDLTLETKTKVFLSGELTRLESNGQLVDLSTGQPSPHVQVLVVQPDGEIRELRANPDGRPTGLIKRHSHELSELTLRPVLWACHAPSTLEFDNLIVTRVGPPAFAVDALHLSNKDGTQQFWLDVNRDYSVLRLTRHYPGESKQRFQLDIDYMNAPKARWVPSRWSYTWHKANRLKEKVEARLTSYKLNAPLKPGLFTLAFPAGTPVYDMTDPKVQVLYKYLPSGERVEVSREVLGGGRKTPPLLQ